MKKRRTNPWWIIAAAVTLVVAGVLAARAFSWADKALHEAALIAHWNG